MITYFLLLIICSHVFTEKSAYQNGTFIIGVLLPMHRANKSSTEFDTACAEIWPQYGIHRIEQFFRTIDEINNNPDLLPGITLGYDIRDSCWKSTHALKQSMDFVRDKIDHLNRKNRSMTISTPRQSAKEMCSVDDIKPPIIALIGPGSSRTTIKVQSVLSLFNIPQIGYSATSSDLSDRTANNMFVRVVDSDVKQAQVLVDMCIHFNWTYVSTVYSDDNYGRGGIKQVHKILKQKKICVANRNSDGEEGFPLKSSAKDKEYYRVIDTLLQDEKARVVLCFCQGDTIKQIFSAMKRHPRALGRLLFIGTDGWSGRPDVTENHELAAAGAFAIKLHSPPIVDFDTHFLSLNPYNNTRNPWFREYWEQVFKCSLNRTISPLVNISRCDKFLNISTKRETQDGKLGFVINAVYSIAYALDNLRIKFCGNGTYGACPELTNILSGKLLLDTLMNISFTSYSGSIVKFDEFGNGPGRYDILNFQRLIGKGENRTDKFIYKRVALWDLDRFSVNESDIRWPSIDLSSDNFIPVQSICSTPCEQGEIKKLISDVICCWKCIKVPAVAIIIDEYTYKNCPDGWFPNKAKTACLMNKVEYIAWNDDSALLALISAGFGIIFALWITYVFIKNNNTPVVKSSTRELTYMILTGVICSYLSTFSYIAKPSIVSCHLNRVIPGLSFCLIYGALVTKTNRIARILAAGKKKIMTRKPRFLTSTAQVIVTFILLGIEAAVITFTLVYQPADSKLIYISTDEKSKIRLICNTGDVGLFAPLGFSLFLILLCTFYAIKTRKLPENFNEAKFIGFTMYTTCIIWLAYVGLYVGGQDKFEDTMIINTCLAINISSSVTLALLFGPKVYIIVWKPERNVRSQFTTAAKDIRCHIGTTGAGSTVSRDTDKPNTALAVIPEDHNENNYVTPRKGFRASVFSIIEQTVTSVKSVVLPNSPDESGQSPISHHDHRFSVSKTDSKKSAGNTGLFHRYCDGDLYGRNGDEPMYSEAASWPPQSKSSSRRSFLSNCLARLPLVSWISSRFSTKSTDAALHSRKHSVYSEYFSSKFDNTTIREIRFVSTQTEDNLMLPHLATYLRQRMKSCLHKVTCPCACKDIGDADVATDLSRTNTSVIHESICDNRNVELYKDGFNNMEKVEFDTPSYPISNDKLQNRSQQIQDSDVQTRSILRVKRSASPYSCSPCDMPDIASMKDKHVLPKNEVVIQHKESFDRISRDIQCDNSVDLDKDNLGTPLLSREFISPPPLPEVPRMSNIDSHPITLASKHNVSAYRHNDSPGDEQIYINLNEPGAVQRFRRHQPVGEIIDYSTSLSNSTVHSSSKTGTPSSKGGFTATAAVRKPSPLLTNMNDNTDVMNNSTNSGTHRSYSSHASSNSFIDRRHTARVSSSSISSVSKKRHSKSPSPMMLSIEDDSAIDGSKVADNHEIIVFQSVVNSNETSFSPSIVPLSPGSGDYQYYGDADGPHEISNNSHYSKNRSNQQRTSTRQSLRRIYPLAVNKKNMSPSKTIFNAAFTPNSNCVTSLINSNQNNNNVRYDTDSQNSSILDMTLTAEISPWLDAKLSPNLNRVADETRYLRENQLSLVKSRFGCYDDNEEDAINYNDENDFLNNDNISSSINGNDAANDSTLRTITPMSMQDVIDTEDEQNNYAECCGILSKSNDDSRTNHRQTNECSTNEVNDSLSNLSMLSNTVLSSNSSSGGCGDSNTVDGSYGNNNNNSVPIVSMDDLSNIGIQFDPKIDRRDSLYRFQSYLAAKGVHLDISSAIISEV